MAGRGPLPKPTSSRSRAGRRWLRAVPDVPPPELPADLVEGDWHPAVVTWWRDLWSSPMAPEYVDSDRHGLLMLAVLLDRYWREPTTQLAAEIRLQRACYGLSPTDRQRLRWEVDRGEQAAADTARRRARSVPNAVDPPAPSARKAEWVDYAAARSGRPTAELARLTKTQLLDEYGPTAAPPDPRDALSAEH